MDSNLQVANQIQMQKSILPPRSQMQQLVSHWGTIMQTPNTTSKKRGRDTEQPTLQTQDTSRQRVTNHQIQHGNLQEHEPFASSFS